MPNHHQDRSNVSDRPTAIVVGGGIIGCAAALELVKAGFACTVLDQGALLQEASTAAAGMLGAQVEIHEPGPFYELCVHSQELYRPWTEELEELTGIATEYVAEGIIRVALEEEDEAELRSRLPWMRSAQWLSAEQIRSAEPEVAPGVRGGLMLERDHHIMPTALANALRAALVKLGCRIREWTPAYRLLQREGRIAGVQTAEGPLYADVTVLAAGAWAPALTEPLGLELPVFPVKGQCISLRPEAPLNRSTLFTKGCYIVPKLDGTALIGATQLEAGFDKRTDAEAVAELYRRACGLLPAMRGAAFVRTWAGLRPGSRDGLPFIGTWPSAPGLVFAAGHYRNGILLAPGTGLLVKQLALGERTALDLTAFAPGRAAEAAGVSG